MGLSDRLTELLRNQAPYAGTDLPSSPVVSFFADLAARVDAVDGQVPRVLSVTLTAAETSLAPLDTEQVTATVVAQGGAAQTVTWESSDEGVAIVSSSGLVTAGAEGTTVITATSTFDTSVSGSITFTVA